MDQALTILAVLANVFAALLITDRGVALWRSLKPENERAGALEADFVELKAYTHKNIHDIRGELQTIRSLIAVLNERLVRLEAKIDAQAVVHTETLDRVLKLIEVLSTKATEAKIQ